MTVRYQRFAAVIRVIGAIILWSSVVIYFFPARVPAADPVEPEQRAVPAGFVNLGDFIPGMLIDVKYAGKDNFMGRVLDGYGAPKALLMEGPAKALREVCDSLKKKGFRLKVFDAYRPMRAEKDMIRWAGVKEERKRFIREGYVPSRVWAGRRVGHVCGNTVDLTIADAAGKDLDMGTAFDEFSRASWTMNAKGQALRNRLLLKREMEARGFVNYDREWWHFTHPEYPAPARDFEIR